MKEIMKCSICNAENTRQYWTEEFGIVEDYYYCNFCGYFHEMAYSPCNEGIELMSNFKKFIKQIIILLKHFNNTRKYQFSRSHCF